MTGSSNSPAQVADPLESVYDDLQDMTKFYAEYEGEGDTPEYKAMDIRYDAAYDAIYKTPPITRRGAACKLRFLEQDMDGSAEGKYWPLALEQVIEFLEGDAQATSQ